MTTKINLLPPKMKDGRRVNWGRHLTIFAVLVVMAAPVAYWGYLLTRTTQSNRVALAAKAEFTTYTEVLAKDRQLTEMERSLTDKKRFIQGLNSPLRWAGMLYEITTYIPRTVVLDEIRSLGEEKVQPGQAATASAPAPAPSAETGLAGTTGSSGSGQASPPPTPPASGTTSPGGVTVPSIANRILMTGHAGSLEAIGQFMVGIQSAKYLSVPELSFAVEEQGGFKFEIVAAIRR
ncbi:MAG: hypothetical protein ACYC53_09140 [Bacillota bacterium]